MGRRGRERQGGEGEVRGREETWREIEEERGSEEERVRNSQV
jgi:hypothetical protein